MTEKVIPGTVLPYNDIQGSMFSGFIPMIRATDGLSLGQICAVTGLEASTVQNWIKRGFVARPQNRKYYERHFARILLISALREAMKIDRIGELMAFINGDTEDISDDIIPEPLLYDYLCECVRRLDTVADDSGIRDCVNEVIAERDFSDISVRKKLTSALMVMVTAYISSLLKQRSEKYFGELASL